MVKVFAVVFFSVIFSLSAQAKEKNAKTSQNETNKVSDPITMGEPTYGGSGCVQGSVSTTLTEDKKSLSIIFDNFVAQAGGSTNRQKDIKKCNVSIPVRVPQGMQFALLKTDQRGFYSVPNKGTASYLSSYYITDTGNHFRLSFQDNKTTNIKSNNEDEYTFSHQFAALVWSPCGTNVNLHLDKTVTVTSNKNMDEAMATVDSIDNAISKKQPGFELFWRNCK